MICFLKPTTAGVESYIPTMLQPLLNEGEVRFSRTSSPRWFKPWPFFYPIVGGHQQPLKESLKHPKKVTSRIARTSFFLRRCHHSHRKKVGSVSQGELLGELAQAFESSGHPRDFGVKLCEASASTRKSVEFYHIQQQKYTKIYLYVFTHFHFGSK